MLNPTFTIKLGQQIYSGLVVVGKCKILSPLIHLPERYAFCGVVDGKIPSLACGTTGGKVLIHSPHEQHENTEINSLNSIRFLNLNRKLTSIAAGSLSSSKATIANEANHDLLFVGTQSNLLAYNVERNADAFFVDVQDGVNSLLVGNVNNSPNPVVIAGGNCSVLGFDAKGSEVFWTVTGDNVSSLALCDIDSKGSPVLMVGSDDFEIRMFRNEELIGEITEADRVTFITPLNKSKFAYGLANGTVGVYSGVKSRQWRVKTKHNVTAVHAYDLDLDGVAEIFSGFNNGTFSVRKESNGEVVFKNSVNAPVAAIVSADYRMDGKEEVMICSEAGEIKAFLSTDMEFGTMFDSGVAKDSESDQKALNELQAQKLEILTELKALEKITMSAKPSPSLEPGALPGDTNLTYNLEPDLNNRAVIFKVSVNTDVQIINLIAIDLEGMVLVDREAIAVSPKEQSKTAALPLIPCKNCACTLRIQTHVATRSLGGQLHVFESDLKVPKFAIFQQISQEDKNYYVPNSKVIFTIHDSIGRIKSWFNSVFILKETIETGDDKIKANFVAVCGLAKSKNSEKVGVANGIGLQLEAGQILCVSVAKKVDSGQTVSVIRLQCDCMDLVADMVQDIAKYFKCTELESEADFPRELELFEEVLNRVTECNSARLNLAADMADDAQRIKALIVRAEDARLMPDMDLMRKSYTELNVLNTQLIGAYNIRAANHENLLVALKDVNQMIQKAANLRVGKAKTRVITDCRAAVKVNNMQSLFRIIQRGYDPNNSTNNLSTK